VSMINRSRFLAASATMVAGAVAPAAADAVPGGTNFVERRAQFDFGAFDAVVGRPAQIRQVIEAVAFRPAMLGNVKNCFNGLQFGYGHPADQIAIAIAGHGPSAGYTYSDYIWQKYRFGELFKIEDAQGKTIESNIWFKATTTFNPAADPDDEHGMYQDASIQMLQRRGVMFLTCHTGVEEQAREIVKRGFAPAGMGAKDVAADMLTHLIPGALVNPSIVATVAVIQKVYKYTYAALTI
jgi:hypothetical protein